MVKLPSIYVTGVSFSAGNMILCWLLHKLMAWYQDNFCTFDIIGKFAFSSDFGCLESSRYHPWVRLVVFQQREIEWITEMKRQGLTFVVAIIKKIFAKHKQEFLGYTEYGLADLISTIVQECVGEDANERHRQKLNERIRLGSQSDVMEGILNNKDGMVRQTFSGHRIESLVRNALNITDRNSIRSAWLRTRLCSSPPGPRPPLLC